MEPTTPTTDLATANIDTISSADSTKKTTGADLLASLKIEIEAFKDREPSKAAAVLDIIDDLEAGIKKLDAAVEGEDEITPYKVASKGAIQYEVFREKWGLKSIDQPLIDRIERITGKKVHFWIRRQIFYCHVDFDKFLDAYEAGRPCYLYSGRGPSSSSLHMGHRGPFVMIKWIQDTFNIPVIIQMSDDEKVYAKDDLTHETVYQLTLENAKDIIAFGLNPDKTWIFSNMKTVGGDYYVNIGKLLKLTNLGTAKHIFGFTNSTNLGVVGWVSSQEGPCFSSSFPDVLGQKKSFPLVVLSIDQMPYFRHVRDVAEHKTLKGFKPAVIASKFFPPLTGVGGKMDSTGKTPAVWMTDSKERVKKAIGGAVSGGAETLEQQLKEGSNLDADIPYQWLRFFLEDDEELAKIAKAYGTRQSDDTTPDSERLSTGQVKARLTEVVTKVVLDHQAARAAVTDEVLNKFMTRRSLI